jgi:hypothetical protein
MERQFLRPIRTDGRFIFDQVFFSIRDFRECQPPVWRTLDIPHAVAYAWIIQRIISGFARKPRKYKNLPHFRFDLREMEHELCFYKSTGPDFSPSYEDVTEIVEDLARVPVFPTSYYAKNGEKRIDTYNLIRRVKDGEYIRYIHVYKEPFEELSGGAVKLYEQPQFMFDGKNFTPTACGDVPTPEFMASFNDDDPWFGKANKDVRERYEAGIKEDTSWKRNPEIMKEVLKNAASIRQAQASGSNNPLADVFGSNNPVPSDSQSNNPLPSDGNENIPENVIMFPSKSEAV